MFVGCVCVGPGRVKLVCGPAAGHVY